MTEQLPRYFIGIFFVLIGICLFWGLGNYGLLNNNDGLYTEIALEMISRGDYIVPHLNGVPYLEKPPLLYWLIAGSFKIFGVHEWAARIVTSSCGLATIIVTYLSANLFLSRRTAILSALIMGTSIGFAVISRVVFFEMLLTLLLSSTLLSYVYWHLTHRRHYLRICYVMMALAVLAKGFIAIILAGLVIVTFNIATKRPLKLWFKDFDSVGVCLFVMIMLPWHVFMIKRDAHFAWFYFINEHVLRFLGQRLPKDYYHGPFYYYTYRLVVYLFPWSLLLAVFCLRPARQLKISISKSEHDYKLFLLIWFLIFFIFFSLSRAKANYYMITAVPPLVILLSHRLDQIMADRRKIVLFLLQFFTLTFALLASLTLCFKNHLLPINFDAMINPALQDCIYNIQDSLLLGLILTGLTSVALRSLKPQQIIQQFSLLGMTSTLLIVIATYVAPQFETIFSSRNIVQACHLKTDRTCYFRDYERFSSFIYYLGAPIPIIDSLSNDLLYGQQHGDRPDLFLSSSTDKPTILTRCANVIVASDRILPFQQQFTDYHAIFANTKLSIFAR